jgi:hypothetical protein
LAASATATADDDFTNRSVVAPKVSQASGEYATAVTVTAGFGRNGPQHAVLEQGGNGERYGGLGRLLIVSVKDSAITVRMDHQIWCDVSVCQTRDAIANRTVLEFYRDAYLENNQAVFVTADHLRIPREFVDSAGVLT